MHSWLHHGSRPWRGRTYQTPPAQQTELAHEVRAEPTDSPSAVPTLSLPIDSLRLPRPALGELSLLAFTVEMAQRQRDPNVSVAPNQPTCGASPHLSILVVCTANVCRSPLGQVALGHSLSVAGVSAEVTSAGTVRSSLSVDPRTAARARAFRADLSAHVSRPLTQSVIATDGRDLVLTMTRTQLREVVATAPDAIVRAFTLRDFARKAQGEPPQRSETVPEWIRRLTVKRVPNDLLGSRPLDDLDDPFGQKDQLFDDIAAEIELLSVQIAAAIASIASVRTPGPSGEQHLNR